MSLGWRARRRWALAILLVGLPLYVMAAVTLVGLHRAAGDLVELAIYVALGIAWALPFRFVFRGVGARTATGAESIGDLRRFAGSRSKPPRCTLLWSGCVTAVPTGREPMIVSHSRRFIFLKTKKTAGHLARDRALEVLRAGRHPDAAGRLRREDAASRFGRRGAELQQALPELLAGESAPAGEAQGDAQVHRAHGRRGHAASGSASGVWNELFQVHHRAEPVRPHRSAAISGRSTTAIATRRSLERDDFDQFLRYSPSS